MRIADQTSMPIRDRIELNTQYSFIELFNPLRCSTTWKSFYRGGSFILCHADISNKYRQNKIRYQITIIQDENDMEISSSEIIFFAADLLLVCFFLMTQSQGSFFI